MNFISIVMNDERYCIVSVQYSTVQNNLAMFPRALAISYNGCESHCNCQNISADAHIIASNEQKNVKSEYDGVPKFHNILVVLLSHCVSHTY